MLYFDSNGVVWGASFRIMDKFIEGPLRGAVSHALELYSPEFDPLPIAKSTKNTRSE